MHREHVGSGLAQPLLRSALAAALALGLFGLDGCMVGPNYHPQNPSMPPEWYGSTTCPARVRAGPACPLVGGL